MQRTSLQLIVAAFLLATKMLATLATEGVIGEEAFLELQTQEGQEDRLLSVLVPMILKDFAEHPQNYLVKYGGSNPAANYMANKLLQRIGGVPVHVGLFHEIKFLYNLHTRFIFTDTQSTFSDLVEQKRVKEINSNAVRYMIVLLPGETLAPVADIMHDIFRVMHDMYMLNANIVLPLANGSIAFYYFNPFNAKKCGTTRPILLYMYEGGELPSLSSLFSNTNKTINFNRCPLKVATAHLPPFITLDHSKHGLEAVSGLEGQIIRFLAKKLNFTLDLLDVGEEAMRGVVYPNHTTTGVYKLLENRGANLTVGECRCSSSIMRRLTSTKNYYQSRVHILFKANDPYTSLEVLFYPFEKFTWALLIMSCLVRFTLLTVLHKPTRSLPKTFRRFMLAMWLILVFYYRSLYEGLCFNFLRNRPLKPLPKTFSELLDQRYSIIFDESTKNLIDLSGLEEERIVRWAAEPEETIGNLTKLSGKYGVLVKKEYFNYYVQHTSLVDTGFFWLPESFVADLHCMYMPRYSHFEEFINLIIGNLRNFGIVNKLVRDYAHVRRVVYPTSHQKLLRSRQHSMWKPLGFHYLHGVLLLLAVFWLLAGLVFCAELLSKRFSTLKLLLQMFHK